MGTLSRTHTGWTVASHRSRSRAQAGMPTPFVNRATVAAGSVMSTWRCTRNRSRPTSSPGLAKRPLGHLHEGVPPGRVALTGAVESVLGFAGAQPRPWRRRPRHPRRTDGSGRRHRRGTSSAPARRRRLRGGVLVGLVLERVRGHDPTQLGDRGRRRQLTRRCLVAPGYPPRDDGDLVDGQGARFDASRVAGSSARRDAMPHDLGGAAGDSPVCQATHCAGEWMPQPCHGGPLECASPATRETSRVVLG